MKEFLKKTLIVFIVFSVMLAVYIVVYGIKNGFEVLELYRNGFQLFGLIALFVGLIGLVADLGGFDLLGYSFNYLIDSKYKTEDRKYQNYQDYMEKKAITRKKNMPSLLAYAIVSLVFILVSLIITIWL